MDSTQTQEEFSAESKEQERKLQTHFTGRRAALRTCKFLDCSIRGESETFTSMAVDISRTGALIRVLDTSFAGPDEKTQLMLYTARVWFHFEDGLEISFLDGSIVLAADVVRVSGYCGRGGGLNLIGIHFRTELTEEECAQLDIPCVDDRPSMGPLKDEAEAASSAD
jgi:hypothetical protein